MSDFLTYIKNLKEQPTFLQGDTASTAQESAPITVPLNGQELIVTKDSKEANKFTFIKDTPINTIEKAANTAPTTGTTAPISTSAVRIPIGQSAKSVTADGTIPGFGIEKTTTTEKPSGADSSSTESKKPFVKTGESMGERLDRFYNGKYSKATPEEKEKMVEKYITTYFSQVRGKTDKEKTKLQLADFRKLVHNTQNIEDRKIIGRSIHKLREANQIQGAHSAINDASTEAVKNAGAIGVAEATHKCAPKNQVGLTQEVVNSGSKDAMVAAGNHLSEDDKHIQSKIAEVLAKPDLVEVNKAIVDQTNKCHVSQQLDITKTVLHSEHKESVKYAAANIHNLDERVQSRIVKHIIEKQNKIAMQVAIGQMNKMTKETQAEIRKMIRESKYEDAQVALEQAEKKAQAQEEAAAKARQDDDDNDIDEDSKTTESAKTETAAKDEDSSDTMKEVSTILNSRSMNKEALLKDKIGNLNKSEQLNLLESTPKNELASLLAVILQSNPSSEVRSKALELADSLPEQDKDKFINDNTNYFTKGSQIGLVSAQTQSLILKASADNGTLQNINRNFLTASLKKEYDNHTKG